MKQWLCGVLCCGALLGCGSSDDVNTDDDLSAGKNGQSCTVLPGLPGSGEYLLKCPDGTQVKLKTVKPGDNGESCTISEGDAGKRELVCPDGTRTTLSDGSGSGVGKLRIVRRAEPAGEHCAAGGEALELYEEGAQTPLETFYECAPSCEPSRSYDMGLKRCVGMVGVRFEGVIEEGDASTLPAALRPAGALVPNTTPCSGTYKGPVDLVPLEGYSAGVDVATYVFGHVSIYDLFMEVGGVRYGRDLGRLSPTDLKMSRGKSYGADPMVEPLFAVKIESSGVNGLEEFSSSKVELRGEVEMMQRGPMTYAPPATLEEWTPLLAGAGSPRLILDASDFIAGKYVQITCRIERFLPLE